MQKIHAEPPPPPPLRWTVGCAVVFLSQLCVARLFPVSGVSLGPWCQSAHQPAGLLLHRPAAQRSHTWAGPRRGSIEVRRAHHSITRSATMTTGRVKRNQWGYTRGLTSATACSLWPIMTHYILILFINIWTVTALTAGCKQRAFLCQQPDKQSTTIYMIRSALLRCSRISWSCCRYDCRRDGSEWVLRFFY